MLQGNSTSGEVKQPEFDSLIEKLRLIVTEGKQISDAFYEKATKLSSLTLDCDQEAKEEDRKEEPQGHITNLNELIYVLKFLNKRNNEILEHIDEII